MTMSRITLDHLLHIAAFLIVSDSTWMARVTQNTPLATLSLKLMPSDDELEKDSQRPVGLST